MPMKQRLFFTVENQKAVTFAARELEKRGVNIAARPSPDVTHLLLSVPCRMTGSELNSVLAKLPQDITVLGGFLDQPELEGYRCIDLLKDERYLAQNARITAFCALNLASVRLPVTWDDCSVLILGWGRIGKCLAALLKDLGATVTVAARKDKDRAMADALGFETEDIGGLGYILQRYRVIFNTVPSPILSEEQVAHCHPDCLKIDLASRPGIAGDDVIDGRGLPGRLAPESSGKLIARSVLRLCAQKEAAL